MPLKPHIAAPAGSTSWKGFFVMQNTLTPETPAYRPAPLTERIETHREALTVPAEQVRERVGIASLDIFCHFLGIC
ncbi:hypothetical protein GCM10010324_54410 [Streptomyces hiroshimensis]|uniref:Uncharacterized protein n=2 Tax=Streptomyces hiroshimensis TaxID=66424 RepID=A0ABQ2Z025_9ACTN|nr:hypothetical protein GCM10010324_54410 [Streptomyces hiroshimensis]